MIKSLKEIAFLLLSVIAFILLSCTSKEIKNNPASSVDTLQKKINQSVEDFYNRPIYKVLTEQIIDTTSDDDLVQVIFDNLSSKIPDDYQKVYTTVLTWNKSQQAIYIIWWMEAEVNNGGFNQFYTNPSGQFYKFLPNALRLIGAEKFADLTDRANKTYTTENTKINKHQDGTLEGFSKSYEGNPLNKYDAEFYKLYDIEQLYKIQTAYIRNHKSDFIDN